jgi:hypothetical protein
MAVRVKFYVPVRDSLKSVRKGTNPSVRSRHSHSFSLQYLCLPDSTECVPDSTECVPDSTECLHDSTECA